MSSNLSVMPFLEQGWGFGVEGGHREVEQYVEDVRGLGLVALILVDPTNPDHEVALTQWGPESTSQD